ncbi:hypothetical protein ABPG75_002150 [Micractinium tetrahymenae]
MAVEAEPAAPGPATATAAPPSCRFALSVFLDGVAPADAYRHMADPNSLLGLQPLLVAVEGIQRAPTSGPAAGAADTPAMPATASGDSCPAELRFEAVELHRFCWGLLPWRNHIAVRQQLLGHLPLAALSAAPESAAASAPATAEPAAAAAAEPVRMRFLVTSPPAGLVRLEVLWTFAAAGLASGVQAGPEAAHMARPASPPPAAPAAAAAAAAHASTVPTPPAGRAAADDSLQRSTGGGTEVQLEAAVQAPWLLRGFVLSQARRAQERLLSNLKQRLEAQQAQQTGDSRSAPAAGAQRSVGGPST